MFDADSALTVSDEIQGFSDGVWECMVLVERWASQCEVDVSNEDRNVTTCTL